MNPAITEYRFTGADYDAVFDHERLATHLDRIRALMLDAEWRTAAEIAAALRLPETSDITKQLRHLRYPEHGQHFVERRRRGDERRGLYEYRVHEAGSGDSVARKVGEAAELEAARLTIELLVSALRALDPNHPLLQELGL